MASDCVDLDARLAMALRLGARWPLPVWKEPEDPDVISEIRALRKRANRGETIPVARAELAEAVSRLTELPEPRIQESADVLVSLVLTLQNNGWLGDPTAPGRPAVSYLDQIDRFGWPLCDPSEDIYPHVVAAADLGVFALPGQPLRPLPPPRTDLGPNQRELRIVFVKPEPFTVEPRVLDHGGNEIPSPPKPDLPLGKVFLRDWEIQLTAIVNHILDELEGLKFLTLHDY
ncbi:MAG: hypothetical protein ACYDHH_23925 [Solirubrobacteraceae bacterium]